MPLLAKYPKSRVKSKRVSIAYAFRNPEKFKFGYHDKYRDEFVNCGKLIDDYGYSANSKNAKLWAFGNECGYCHLVHCKNESDGYSAHLDESPTIEENELHEAYDAHEKLSKWLINKGHANDQALNLFCIRWADTFFRISTHNANYTGAWDNWELGEGYSYQSNSTDTGIVNIGHNGHYSEIKWKDLVILPK